MGSLPYCPENIVTDRPLAGPVSLTARRIAVDEPPRIFRHHAIPPCLEGHGLDGRSSVSDADFADPQYRKTRPCAAPQLSSDILASGNEKKILCLLVVRSFFTHLYSNSYTTNIVARLFLSHFQQHLLGRVVGDDAQATLLLQGIKQELTTPVEIVDIKSPLSLPP